MSLGTISYLSTAVAAPRVTESINRPSAVQGEYSHQSPPISAVGIVIVIILSIVGTWCLGLRLQQKQKLNRMYLLLQHVAQLERLVSCTSDSVRSPKP